MQIHRDIQYRLFIARGWREGKMRSYWSEENVLELNGGGGYTTLQLY